MQAEPNLVRNITLIEVDWSKETTGLSRDECLAKILAREDFLGSEFGYSAFATESIETVRRVGCTHLDTDDNPSNSIFCCRHIIRNGENFFEEPADDLSINEYLEHYVTNTGEVALAVYRLDKLGKSLTTGGELYFNPGALEAIFKLTNY